MAEGFTSNAMSLSLQFRTATAGSGLIERIIKGAIGSISILLLDSNGNPTNAGSCTQTAIDLSFVGEWSISRISIQALEPALLSAGPNGRLFGIEWHTQQERRREFISNFDCRFLANWQPFFFDFQKTMLTYGTTNMIRFLIKGHTQGRVNDYQLTLHAEEY